MLLFLLTPCLAVAVQLCVVHSVGQLISVACWGKNWPAISNIFLSIVDMISKEIWDGGLALYVTYRRSRYRSDLFFNYLGKRMGCKQLGELNFKKGRGGWHYALFIEISRMQYFWSKICNRKKSQTNLSFVIDYPQRVFSYPQCYSLFLFTSRALNKQSKGSKRHHIKTLLYFIINLLLKP